jgi:hypothetical protein
MSRRKWRALHSVEDEYCETLEVTEQSDGNFVYVVCGSVASCRDAESAMVAADRLFARLYPTHKCGRICAPWALRRPEPTT